MEATVSGMIGLPLHPLSYHQGLFKSCACCLWFTWPELSAAATVTFLLLNLCSVFLSLLMFHCLVFIHSWSCFRRNIFYTFLCFSKPLFCVAIVQNTNQKYKEVKIVLKNISFNIGKYLNIVRFFPITTCQGGSVCYHSRTFIKHFFL